MDRANRRSPRDRDEEEFFRNVSSGSDKPYWYYGVLLAVALLIVWFTRPMWHDFIFGFWKYGEVLNVILVTGVVAFFTYRSSRSVIRTAQVAAVMFLLSWMLFMALGNLVTQKSLSDELTFTERSTIADVDTENPRILPQRVSDRFAQNTLQFPRHRLSNADITILNGSPHWSYGLEPDGGLNRFAIDQKGATFVDMTTSSRSLRTVEQDMNPGLGMAVWRNYLWQLQKDKYWVEHQEPFMVMEDDELFIAVPYIEYDLKLFPILHTIPSWGGVALIDSEGDISHLSPEEAQEHEVLEEQRLYPYDLARKEVNSMRFRNGIINFLFFHEDQLEIAPVNNHMNEQPFFVPTEEGLKYFIAVEPYGDAAGVFEVWQFDAQSGSAEVYKIHEDDSLLGPNRASDYVRRASPMVDWDRLVPSEPLPVVVEDRLYWMLRIVPRDGSGISYTAFVDAESTDVVAFEEDEEIVEFLNGEVEVDGESDDGLENESVPNGEEVTVTIVEDGDVLSSHVITGNASVEIER